MIKKITNLTKVFLKDYYQNLNIINKKNKKLNKNSIFTWLIIILIIAIVYMSFHAISFLQKINSAILFLKIYLPIIATIMIIQLINLSCRMLYYSKDLEYIMPLPVKTSEILISKLNSIIIITYFLEILFLFLPLLIYGMLELKTFGYFISMIIIMVIFPILFSTIISTAMLFIMKLSKFVKNQDIFQILVVFILTSIIMFAEITLIEKIIFEPTPEKLDTLQMIEMKADQVNETFIVINPIITILENNKFLNKLIEIAKLLIINIIPIILFILLGKKLYLKNILQNKEIKQIKGKNKYKYENRIIQYLKKDVKQIIKNPTNFIQNVFQYLCLVIVCILLLKLFIPIFISEIKNEDMLSKMNMDDFKLQGILIVIGLLQLVFTFCNLSITAISREGKNAAFIKYIPISLHQQFKIKALPQILLNTVVIWMLLDTIYFEVPEITIEYYIITFIMGMIINIINSYISLIFDLKNPNLNWTNEESVVKNNPNKIYQYVTTIFMCLIFVYISKVFEGISLIISISSSILILLLILILLEIYIKKNINKLFNKIN